MTARAETATRHYHVASLPRPRPGSHLYPELRLSFFLSDFIYFLSKLYAQLGAGTRDPEIKSHTPPAEPARHPNAISLFFTEIQRVLTMSHVSLLLTK